MIILLSLFLITISLLLYLYTIINYDLNTATDPLQIERFINQVPNLQNEVNIKTAEKFYSSLSNYFDTLVSQNKLTSDQSSSILNGLLGIAFTVKGFENSPIDWNYFLKNYYYSSTPPTIQN